MNSSLIASGSEAPQSNTEWGCSAHERAVKPVTMQARIFLGQEEDEQLRDLVMSMVGNPLVILIKLADRLHNMRTVYALKPNKARAVAAETRQLWCSLAERLGILPLKVIQAPSFVVRPGPMHVHLSASSFLP